MRDGTGKCNCSVLCVAVREVAREMELGSVTATLVTMEHCALSVPLVSLKKLAMILMFYVEVRLLCM